MAMQIDKQLATHGGACGYFVHCEGVGFVEPGTTAHTPEQALLGAAPETIPDLQPVRAGQSKQQRKEQHESKVSLSVLREVRADSTRAFGG